jgi:hypothetical protein
MRGTVDPVAPIEVVLDQPAPTREVLRSVLGSLPRSFVPVATRPEGRPWVAALEGGRGWAVDALWSFRDGAACVVVLLPGPEDPRRARGAGCRGRRPRRAAAPVVPQPGPAAYAGASRAGGCPAARQPGRRPRRS